MTTYLQGLRNKLSLERIKDDGTPNGIRSADSCRAGFILGWDAATQELAQEKDNLIAGYELRMIMKRQELNAYRVQCDKLAEALEQIVNYVGEDSMGSDCAFEAASALDEFKVFKQEMDKK